MKSVFIAHPFRAEVDSLVRNVEDLLYSHGFRAESGKSLAGAALTDGVKAKIERADALVAIFTPDKSPVAGEVVATTDWVESEFVHACSKEKRTVRLVDRRVKPYAGMYAEHEWHELDLEHPLPAILRLSHTLGEWRRVLQTDLIQILPTDVARAIPDGHAVTYEFGDLQAGPESIRTGKAPARRVGEGVLVRLQGLEENHRVRLRLERDARVMQTEWSPCWRTVTFPAQNGGGA